MAQKDIRELHESRKTERFTIEEKEATLYLSGEENRPLIVLNNFSGDGQSVVDELQAMDAPEHNLLCIGHLQWDHDMAPWYCPPLSADDTPCTGGADAYLTLLLQSILPKAFALVRGAPSHIGIAGYSLAGLFALYACYHCDTFDWAASMSGSLWFPDFKEYIFEHTMQRRPDKLYLSLGDKEARARHPLLKTVRHNTEEIVAFYQKQGLDVTWELNPGNHFMDAARRSAKGIAALLA